MPLYGAEQSGWHDIADREDFIVVYPKPAVNKMWNVWDDPVLPSDHAFILALLAYLKDTYPIDETRVYVTGFSMGGMMTHSLACAHPELFAAAYVMSACPQDMRKGAMSPGWGNRDQNRTANAGGLEGLLNSYQNTWDIAAKLAGRTDLPRFCFSCGTEDPLMYENFKKFRAYAASIGFEAQFDEVPGYSHEWRFWEACIQKAVNFFLPDENGQGNAF